MTLEQLVEQMVKENGRWTVKDGQVYATSRKGLSQEVKQAIAEHKTVIAGIVQLLENGPEVNPISHSLNHIRKQDAARQKRQAAYKEYLQSPHWKQCRSEAMERAGHACQLCKTSGKGLNVHHNNYRNLGHELPTDLVVLCRKCHEKHHMRSA